jgi:hypothetical protein
MNKNPHNFRELYFKINTIIEYLKEHDGYNYGLYNRTCPLYSDEPDSNIVEYAEDIRWIIKNIINENYYDDVPF